MKYSSKNLLLWINPWIFSPTFLFLISIAFINVCMCVCVCMCVASVNMRSIGVRVIWRESRPDIYNSLKCFARCLIVWTVINYFLLDVLNEKRYPGYLGIQWKRFGVVIHTFHRFLSSLWSKTSCYDVFVLFLIPLYLFLLLFMCMFFLITCCSVVKNSNWINGCL